MKGMILNYYMYYDVKEMILNYYYDVKEMILNYYYDVKEMILNYHSVCL